MQSAEVLVKAMKVQLVCTGVILVCTLIIFVCVVLN